jgi:hypothetical protein
MSDMRERADYDHAFVAAVEISEKQAALAVEADPKKRATLMNEIAARDDAITPPKMRHAAERAIRAREKKCRVRLLLQRWIRRYGPPTNISEFILKIERRRWKKFARRKTVAPPGSKRQPGPGRPRELSRGTIRDVLRSLGVSGNRAQKNKMS